VTVSQPGAGARSHELIRVWEVGFSGLDFTTPLLVDAGAPLVISAGPRTGTVTLWRLSAARPDAGACDPIVRSTWGGAAAFSGRIDADLPFVYVCCGNPTRYFFDADGDGVGGFPLTLCYPPSAQYQRAGGDCDDSNPLVKPGVPEVCNGRDDDCDGFIDANDDSLVPTRCENQVGACLDSWHVASGCMNGAWAPCTSTSFDSDYEEVESTCDAIDNDCDGQVDELSDGPPCANQTGVCSGAHASQCVGANWAGCSAVDYPPTYEIRELSCDGLDNDCDGFTDGRDSDLQGKPCELTQGVCASARHSSAECGATGWVQCDARDYGPRFEASETRCDGADNDCDGQVDEGCPTSSCATGLSGPALLAVLTWLSRRRVSR